MLARGTQSPLCRSRKSLTSAGDGRYRARQALRDAAIGVDKARASESRLSEFERLERWRALQLGRWSLVERDGRRYVIAHRNAPTPKADSKLTLRERQVVDFVAMGHSNKLIAYELGISLSSVATHVRRAAVKLGAKSTQALIALIRAQTS